MSFMLKFKPKGKHALRKQFRPAHGALFSVCLLFGFTFGMFNPLGGETLSSASEYTQEVSRGYARSDLSVVTVSVKDGAKEPVQVSMPAGSTVQNVLDKQGITLRPSDSINRLMNSVLKDGDKVTVTRVDVSYDKQETVLPYETVVNEDSSLDAGVEKVDQEGSEGKSVSVFYVRRENGVETERSMLVETIYPQPVSKIIRRGTRPAPTSQASLAPVAPVGEIQSYAHKEVLSKGWSEIDFSALVKLWVRESGWNPQAVNSSSGACGIPQALPCSKIPNPSDWKSQVDWGLNYIAGRYGSPSSALAHSDTVGWY